MSKKRICIVTPAQLSSNPRVVKEAGALHDAGFEVTVIATRINSWTNAQDDLIAEAAGWTPVLIDMRSKVHYVPHRLWQMACSYLYGLTGWSALAPYTLSPFSAAIRSAAKRIKADLYIGHYPPGLNAAHAAASGGRDALIAYDTEDFHPGEFDEDQDGCQLQRAIVDTERQFIYAADFVTAASPGIAEAYEQMYGIVRPTTVLNTFPLDDAPSEWTQMGSEERRPSLYWFSQTIGPFRGLECLVEAVGQSGTKPHLWLRGTPMPGFADQLIQRAETHEIADRLHFLEPTAPSDLPQHASQYDVGVVSEIGHTESRRIALTNKQFTYLLGGVPCLLSDIPAHKALAHDLGAAAVLFRTEDAASLAGAIDEMFSGSLPLSTRRELAFNLARDRYNFTHDARALVDTVRAALNKTTP